MYRELLNTKTPQIIIPILYPPDIPPDISLQYCTPLIMHLHPIALPPYMRLNNQLARPPPPNPNPPPRQPLQDVSFVRPFVCLSPGFSHDIGTYIHTYTYITSHHILYLSPTSNLQSPHIPLHKPLFPPSPPPPNSNQVSVAIPLWPFLLLFVSKPFFSFLFSFLLSRCARVSEPPYAPRID